MATEPTIVNAEISTDYTQNGTSGYAIFVASSGGQSTFTLRNGSIFVIGSTMVYVNYIYQSFTSYTESSSGTSITFSTPITQGNPVEIRYLQSLLS